MEIIRFIKKVLIHPTDARNCGVRFDYKQTLRSQADHRSVDDILANPKVNALLRLDTLDFESTPSQRGILSCDHHAVLFASILRIKGKAVRLRCGYAAYIVPGKLTPHWICEVRDEETRRWEYIDPERALLGLDGIKYRLLSDVNALMKNELLSYEQMIREATPKAPGLFSKGTLKLDRADWDLLDKLAALSLGIDADWTGLCRLYASYVHAENLRTQPGETEAGLRSK